MIVAVLMLKDEAETIAQTLESVLATLGPELREIVVHDTGSSDDTQDICAMYGAHVHCVAWEDFATNRNRVLKFAEEAYAQPGDALLVVDGGMLLRGAPAYAPDANAWRVLVKMGAVTCHRPQMFRAFAGWTYSGRVHETASGIGNIGESDLVVDYCLKDTARAARLPRDLALLEDDYTARGRFYYAQTLEQMGCKAQAFFWYLHRAERVDGWWEERCQAYIRAIPLAPSYSLARWCCGKAIDIDKTRTEAWLQLALYGSSCATTEQDWCAVGIAAGLAQQHTPVAGAFCVDTTREHRARELLARAFFWQGHKAEAKAMWLQLLDDAPEYMHLQIRENIKFCDE